MSDLEQLKKYQDQKLPDCPLCLNWFLGCLNGRKEWSDKSVTPNLRFVGQSGAEYPDSDNQKIPETEYPCRMFCDAFQWDPSKERLGRVVY